MDEVFARGDLSGYLRDLDRSADRQLNEWDSEEFVSLPEDELLSRVAEKLRLEVPRLLLDQAEQLPASGRTVDSQRLIRLEIAVPFEGRRDLLWYVPAGLDADWNRGLRGLAGQLP